MMKSIKITFIQKKHSYRAYKLILFYKFVKVRVN
ncbi:hypothetical protein HMPREF1536_04516 [Parabacteroides gordonii MS-1 = DSM 23371]|jgi:hypothetical protein|uniref:Uncharacterized protein n=1 Tax=Parabacteroides gordonii MS-1 = DSM 23371 TaxID=1203610 RepID=A0A0F5IWD2_9BACT|nr:hypothetical protein HMPREF1536_04516 [Parabacteroides gordonii MS-1 = DSM 23371]CUP13779.1 Uncharacterised protein [Parabacteroides distasonis]